MSLSFLSWMQQFHPGRAITAGFFKEYEDWLRKQGYGHCMDLGPLWGKEGFNVVDPKVVDDWCKGGYKFSEMLAPKVLNPHALLNYSTVDWDPGFKGFVRCSVTIGGVTFTWDPNDPEKYNKAKEILGCDDKGAVALLGHCEKHLKVEDKSDDWIGDTPPGERDEREMKFKGEMILSDSGDAVRIPTDKEWIGINLLERDGELKRAEKSVQDKTDPPGNNKTVQGG